MPASNREEEDRARLDGFEIEIFELVQREATAEQWKEWLRAPLEHAAAEGNLDLFTRLMDAGANGKAGWALMIAGADPNLRDGRKRSPLHLAAEAGHHRVIGSLLLNKADVDATTASRQTPLHLADSEGHTLCVCELLLGGADKDMVDGCGETALCKAAENNHVEAVEKLLAAGANHRVHPGNDFSPCTNAARRGHADVLQALLDKDSSELDATNDFGRAALHYAASFDGPVGNNGDAILVLLGAGADVNVKATTAVCCFTPLHVAVSHWKASNGTICALLEGGGHVNARTQHNNTPLHTAYECASVSVVELLLRWGADEKLANNDGDTPADVVGVLEQNDLDDEERGGHCNMSMVKMVARELAQIQVCQG
ncbi:Pfs, NACHT and Ankyrin domain protein [Ectocarpus siliculosus]|uniref:Pfs, NACHT and Ankyrin domain protein n=1 Tax=Ectocarpus siliculosus TaxID=2880 RepID=D8LQL7_ECTSI|nr:Pfs, NACHT and Ankyrin domain protein [Ectocarpus siliculosus]|eukprot:CBN78781.1 Pfs, NACHT and Ankyrin domain protein [Ectocarpus siliculosus]